MSNQIGFAAELDVTTRGGSFSIRGNEQRIDVTFSSLRTMIHVLRVVRGNRLLCDVVSPIPPSCFIETRIAGRSVAVTGPGLSANLLARLLGAESTRVNVRGLIASLFSSANLKR